LEDSFLSAPLAKRDVWMKTVIAIQQMVCFARNAEMTSSLLLPFAEKRQRLVEVSVRVFVVGVAAEQVLANTTGLRGFCLVPSSSLLLLLLLFVSK
jgi:hypothetical protein